MKVISILADSEKMDIGITYQRILWKGLFTTIEILPLIEDIFGRK